MIRIMMQVACSLIAIHGAFTLSAPDARTPERVTVHGGTSSHKRIRKKRQRAAPMTVEIHPSGSTDAHTEAPNASSELNDIVNASMKYAMGSPSSFHMTSTVDDAANAVTIAADDVANAANEVNEAVDEAASAVTSGINQVTNGISGTFLR